MRLAPGHLDSSGAVLAVYVDDLLIVAPRDKEDKLWADIAAQVSFDEEEAPIGKFLGAHHVFKKDGSVTTPTIEMEDFMKDAAAIYAAEIGATYEARRGPHALPAREPLGLRTEGRRTSGRAVGYVLFALDEAALRRASQPPRHHRGDNAAGIEGIVVEHFTRSPLSGSCSVRGHEA